jgi:hypothetical protein
MKSFDDIAQSVDDWINTAVEFSQPSQADMEAFFADLAKRQGNPELPGWLGMDALKSAASEGLQGFGEALAAQIPPDSKTLAVAWLTQAQAVLASERLSLRQKAAKITDAAAGLGNWEAFKAILQAMAAHYQRLPLSLRVALPAAGLAAPFLGGAGAGIAAFGGAVGVPVLLLLFLGAAGVASILEALLGGKSKTGNETLFAAGILAIIASDIAFSRMNKQIRSRISESVAKPRKQPVSATESILRAELLGMDPVCFERHVMSFFSDAGMTAWVTPASMDAGIDGVAKNGSQLILVQCKRYAPGNLVGRPDIQQFKGVLEENQADIGVFVTTSAFTKHAVESAGKNAKLALVDIDALVAWHVSGFSLPSI